MMKTFYFSTLIVAAASVATAQDLLITEIMDGDLPGGLPKAVEITNIGATSIDLTLYKIANANNGNAAFSSGTPLTGNLAAGASYVIASEATVSATVFGQAPDLTSSTVNINGDDVVGILRVADDTVVDVYGELGVDGTGTAWEHLDSYATRLTSVTAPSATFNVAEWNVRAVASLDGVDEAGHQAIFDFNVPDTGFGTFPTSTSVESWELYD